MPKNPHADFSPVLDGYSGIGAFRFWCQTALPLTYDDSLSYYELLCKVVNYLNHAIEDLSNVEENTDKLAEAYTKLQNYVNEYFDKLDVEAELRNVLDAMAEDGTLDTLLDPLVTNHLPGVVDDKIDAVVANQIDDAVAGQIDETVAEQLPAVVAADIPAEVTNWLTANVNPVGSAVAVDSSLSISGAAADAKVTGDELSGLKTRVNGIANMGQNMLANANWIIGNIASNGGNSDQQTHIRTNNYIRFDDVTYCEITIDSGYSIVVYVYDNSNTVIAKPTSSFEKPADAVTFRIKISKTEETTANLDYANHITVNGYSNIVRNVMTNTVKNTKQDALIAENANDITNLKGSSETITLSFEQGTITSTTGIPNPKNNYRIYTPDAYAINDGLYMDVDNQYQYGIFFYRDRPSTSNNFVSGTGFISGHHELKDTDIVIPSDALYFRIVIKYASGNSVPIVKTDIDTSDYTFTSIIKYAHLTEKDVEYIYTLDYIPPCNPNIIYSCREGQVDSNAYPHNSKWAIKATADNEYDRIRFTVRSVPITQGSNKNAYVCIHDSNINNLARNPDGTQISGQISSNSPLDVLNAYDWGIQYGEKYAGYGVPMLEDALKYSAMYGLGVTLEFNTFLTEAEVNEVFNMCVKYGHISQLMVAARNTTVSRYWQNHSKEISFYAGIEETEIVDDNYMANWLNLKNDLNDIYIQVYPLGNVPSETYIKTAREYGLKICNTQIMSLNDMVAYGFNHGVNMFECANIPKIKRTVKQYADSLID